MGLGHVPPGTVRQEGQGDDVPGRQHRGAGAHLADLSTLTGLSGRRLARFGEDVACSFLTRRGARVLERNLLVGGGEIDILARHGGATLAVEVKTVGFGADAEDPVVRFTPQKALQVRRLAAQVRGHGPLRVDFVGVHLTPSGVIVNWRPAVA